MPEQAWPGVMARLHADVGSERFEAFFQRLRLDALEGATARLSVPTAFLRREIEQRHRETVLRCIRAEVPYVRRLRVSQRSFVLRYSNSPPLALLPSPESVLRPAGRTWSTPALVEVVVTRGMMLKRIRRLAGARHGLERDEMSSPSRKQPLTRARQEAMYLVRIRFKLAWARIGRDFGGRDHTTPMHAVRRIEHDMGDERYRADMENLMRDVDPDYPWDEVRLELITSRAAP